MELWIRNQEKDRLIKCQSLDILDRNQSQLVKEYLGNIELNVMIVGNDSVNLGSYSKERALEILDEIEKRIMLINTINLAKDKESLLAFEKALGKNELQGLSFPYQMPKE